MNLLQAIAPRGSGLDGPRIAAAIGESCAALSWSDKKVLVIVPDATRTAPVGPVFRSLHAEVAASCSQFDVMVALGTHPPMTEEGICERLEITMAERRSAYGSVRFFNHEWDNPEALVRLGSLPSSDIESLSGGLFSMDVDVSINRRLLEYDRIVIIGPVFPHEVVGCSGGNKYLFPGVAGPDILNFFHWLGAVITNPMIIGNKWTPVRRVVDRAAALLPVEKLCFCLVVAGPHFAGLFAGTPEEAWDAASDLSQELHIVRKPHPFHTVLSCAPKMYDELWVGGKCMYKLEPVVADGGELIIFAPHIHEVSAVHGHLIRQIGYHCRDYFLKQWDRFKHLPWGTLAHSTHVRGVGTYENGVENCRIHVTLATGIPRAVCEEIALGYMDPSGIDVESYANREEEGILLVRKAGEMLYHLEDRPSWARQT